MVEKGDMVALCATRRRRLFLSYEVMALNSSQVSLPKKAVPPTPLSRCTVLINFGLFSNHTMPHNSSYLRDVPRRI
jgi:hypothetical protein